MPVICLGFLKNVKICLLRDIYVEKKYGRQKVF